MAPPEKENDNARIPKALIIGSSEINAQNIASVAKSILSDEKSQKVKIISYFTRFSTLEEINALKSRESTQIILYPPDGISQSEATKLSNLQDRNRDFQVKQISNGAEKIVPHLKLILVEQMNGKKCAILGSSNITYSGYHNNIETNVLIEDSDYSDIDLLWDLFDDIWRNFTISLDPDNFFQQELDEFSNKKKYMLPFQKDVYNDLVDIYKKRSEKKKGAILSLPTGAGKTLVAVWFILNHVITHPGICVLWTAPRNELLMQAYEAFHENHQFFKFNDLQIEPPNEQGKWTNKKITEASNWNLIFRSIHSIHSETPKKKFDMIVVDEAHWGSAKKNIMLPSFFQTQNRAFKLGITATPFRKSPGEKGEINQLFGDIIYRSRDYVITLTNALGEPILSDIIPSNISTGVKVKINHSDLNAFYDFNSAFLDRNFVHNRKRNQTIIDSWESYEGQTLIFAINIQHANILTKLFNKKYPNTSIQIVHTGIIPKSISEIIHVKPSRHNEKGYSFTMSDRDIIRKAFYKSQIQVVISVNLYTMGMDFPKVSTILMARPTLSPVIYSQMLGRGTRGPAFGGTLKLQVVDFADQFFIMTELGELLMNYDRQQKFESRDNSQITAAEIFGPCKPKNRLIINSRVCDVLKRPLEGVHIYRIFTAKRRDKIRGWTKHQDLQKCLQNYSDSVTTARNDSVDYVKIDKSEDYHRIKEWLKYNLDTNANPSKKIEAEPIAPSTNITTINSKFKASVDINRDYQTRMKQISVKDFINEFEDEKDDFNGRYIYRIYDEKDRRIVRHWRDITINLFVTIQRYYESKGTRYHNNIIEYLEIIQGENRKHVLSRIKKAELANSR